MKAKGFICAAFFAMAAMVNAQPAANAEAIYGVKSGIITTESDMMGQTMVQVRYFDDYGKKQATEMDFGGGKMRTIQINGETIMVNEDQKTATRMPMGGFGGGGTQVNFLKLTEEVIKSNNIKEIGEEVVAGKTCKKYSMSVSQMGQTSQSTVWVYKGITLKSEAETQMGAMVQAATKLEENATIPASMFTIPEGITVQDMDMNMMGGGF